MPTNFEYNDDVYRKDVTYRLNIRINGAHMEGKDFNEVVESSQRIKDILGKYIQKGTEG